MSFYLNRLAALQQSVLETFGQGAEGNQWSPQALNKLREDLDRQGQGSTEVIGDLEIVFKTLLGDLSAMGLDNEVMF